MSSTISRLAIMEVDKLDRNFNETYLRCSDAFSVAVAYEVVRGVEVLLAKETSLWFVGPVDVMLVRSEVRVLGCLIWATFLAVFTLPGLIHSLVDEPLRLGLVLTPDRLGDMFLHRQRCHLNGCSWPGVDVRIDYTTAISASGSGAGGCSFGRDPRWWRLKREVPVVG